MTARLHKFDVAVETITATATPSKTCVSGHTVVPGADCTHLIVLPVLRIFVENDLTIVVPVKAKAVEIVRVRITNCVAMA